MAKQKKNLEEVSPAAGASLTSEVQQDTVPNVAFDSADDLAVMAKANPAKEKLQGVIDSFPDNNDIANHKVDPVHELNRIKRQLRALLDCV